MNIKPVKKISIHSNLSFVSTYDCIIYLDTFIHNFYLYNLSYIDFFSFFFQGSNDAEKICYVFG